MMLFNNHSFGLTRSLFILYMFTNTIAKALGVLTVFISLHLSPGAKMAHRASTCAFHRFLSCATVCASLQDCHPASDLSFSTVRRQVVFGRPLFLFPSGVLVRAVTQSLSGCFLRMCPMKRHLLLLTSSLNLSKLALFSSSLLLILSCHLIFIILLRHRF